jgi:trigger factor
MSIVLSVEDVGPCRKQLKVSIPAPEVAAETERVVRDIGRRTRLPGFRKGKVPAGVVKRRFKEDVEREVLDRLLPRFWRQAESESALDPLAAPRVEEVGDLAEGEPLTFTAIVEVRPPIELGDLDLLRDGLELPDPAVEPTDDEIGEALDSLRRRAADWTEVERPAARGDRVTVEIVEVLPAAAPAADAEPAAGDEAEDEAEDEAAGDAPGERLGSPETVAVEIGDESIWEELSLALTGLGAGQEGAFTRRPAAEGDAPPRRFRVRADKVEERDLPPLDDAFAAKVGKFADFEALRAEVERGLGEQRREERRRARRQAALDQLRGRHPLTLPDGVVQHETEHLLQDYAQELGRRGVDPRSARVDWEDLARQVRPQAERRVHDRLLLDALAEAEPLAVGDDELERALAVIGRAQGTSAALVRRKLEEDGRLAGLRSQMRRDKALARLVGDDETAADAADVAGGEQPAGGEPEPAVAGEPSGSGS